MMLVRHYSPADAGAVRNLWNQSSTGYAPQTEEGLANLLLNHPDFDRNRAWVAEKSGEIQGFLCCTGTFVACVLTESPEIAELLLDAAQQDAGVRGLNKLQFSYFCPIRLPWRIPQTESAQHNNLPGVPQDTYLFPLLKRLGWQVRAEEVAMYLPLETFVFPAEMAEKAAQMAQKGYTVDWYDETRHHGVDDMVESLHNSMWSAEIPAAAHGGLPLLVGLEGHRVAGFTGPVRREDTGRGYFAGIAVGPAFQGNGLGKLLFYRLLQAEQQVGADYMTLFTGVDNHARQMYRKAGFREVRQFAVMEKEL